METGVSPKEKEASVDFLGDLLNSRDEPRTRKKRVVTDTVKFDRSSAEHVTALIKLLSKKTNDYRGKRLKLREAELDDLADVFATSLPVTLFRTIDSRLTSADIILNPEDEDLKNAVLQCYIAETADSFSRIQAVIDRLVEFVANLQSLPKTKWRSAISDSADYELLVDVFNECLTDFLNLYEETESEYTIERGSADLEMMVNVMEPTLATWAEVARMLRIAKDTVKIPRFDPTKKLKLTMGDMEETVAEIRHRFMDDVCLNEIVTGIKEMVKPTKSAIEYDELSNILRAYGFSPTDNAVIGYVKQQTAQHGGDLVYYEREFIPRLGQLIAFYKNMVLLHGMSPPLTDKDNDYFINVRNALAQKSNPFGQKLLKLYDCFKIEVLPAGGQKYSFDTEKSAKLDELEKMNTILKKLVIVRPAQAFVRLKRQTEIAAKDATFAGAVQALKTGVFGEDSVLFQLLAMYGATEFSGLKDVAVQCVFPDEFSEMDENSVETIEKTAEKEPIIIELIQRIFRDCPYLNGRVQEMESVDDTPEETSVSPALEARPLEETLVATFSPCLFDWDLSPVKEGQNRSDAISGDDFKAFGVKERATSERLSAILDVLLKDVLFICGLTVDERQRFEITKEMVAGMLGSKRVRTALRDASEMIQERGKQKDAPANIGNLDYDIEYQIMLNSIKNENYNSIYLADAAFTPPDQDVRQVTTSLPNTKHTKIYRYVPLRVQLSASTDIIVPVIEAIKLWYIYFGRKRLFNTYHTIERAELDELRGALELKSAEYALLADDDVRKKFNEIYPSVSEFKNAYGAAGKGGDEEIVCEEEYTRFNMIAGRSPPTYEMLTKVALDLDGTTRIFEKTPIKTRRGRKRLAEVAIETVAEQPEDMPDIEPAAPETPSKLPKTLPSTTMPTAIAVPAVTEGVVTSPKPKRRVVPVSVIEPMPSAPSAPVPVPTGIPATPVAVELPVPAKEKEVVEEIVELDEPVITGVMRREPLTPGSIERWKGAKVSTIVPIELPPLLSGVVPAHIFMSAKTMAYVQNCFIHEQATITMDWADAILQQYATRSAVFHLTDVNIDDSLLIYIMNAIDKRPYLRSIVWSSQFPTLPYLKDVGDLVEERPNPMSYITEFVLEGMHFGSELAKSIGSWLATFPALQQLKIIRSDVGCGVDVDPATAFAAMRLLQIVGNTQYKSFFDLLHRPKCKLAKLQTLKCEDIVFDKTAQDAIVLVEIIEKCAATLQSLSVKCDNFNKHFDASYSSQLRALTALGMREEFEPADTICANNSTLIDLEVSRFSGTRLTKFPARLRSLVLLAQSSVAEIPKLETPQLEVLKVNRLGVLPMTLSRLHLVSVRIQNIDFIKNHPTLVNLALTNVRYEGTAPLNILKVVLGEKHIWDTLQVSRCMNINLGEADSQTTSENLRHLIYRYLEGPSPPVALPASLELLWIPASMHHDSILQAANLKQLVLENATAENVKFWCPKLATKALTYFSIELDPTDAQARVEMAKYIPAMKSVKLLNIRNYFPAYKAALKTAILNDYLDSQEKLLPREVGRQVVLNDQYATPMNYLSEYLDTRD